MNYIVIDTETANTMDDPMVYDCGWSVVNEMGEALVERSFVNADIFLEERELMESAYFAEKIPQYIEGINEGTRKLAHFETIRKILASDCRKFGVVGIVAHNMAFDYRACNKTLRWLSKSEKRFFFPYGIEILDSLKMARTVFAKDEDYLNFCRENDYICKNKQPRLTAEILYRYLSGDNDFIESHTGLEDTQIEKLIFAECVKRNREVLRPMWS